MQVFSSLGPFVTVTSKANMSLSTRRPRQTLNTFMPIKYIQTDNWLRDIYTFFSSRGRTWMIEMARRMHATPAHHMKLLGSAKKTLPKTHEQTKFVPASSTALAPWTTSASWRGRGRTTSTRLAWQGGQAARASTSLSGPIGECEPLELSQNPATTASNSIRS